MTFSNYADILAWIIVNKIQRKDEYIIPGDTEEFTKKIQQGLSKVKYIGSIRTFIIESSSIEDESFWLLLLQYIDNSYIIEYEKLHEVKRTNDKNINTVPLNKYYIDKVLIYPKLSENIVSDIGKFYSKGLRKKILFNKLNALLDNYVLIYTEQLQNYEISITNYVDINFSSRVINNNGLNVTFFPFYATPIDEVYTLDLTTKPNYFSIHHSNKEDNEVYKRFKKTIDKYDFNTFNPDIVIFPEMYLNEQIRNDIGKILQNKNIKSSVLFIAGTEWDNNGNKMYVYNRVGEELLVQLKHSPFKWKNGDSEYLEDLIIVEKRLHVIDIARVGRIAFLICKDLMNKEIANILDLLDVNLILVSSYSNSLDVLSLTDTLAKDSQAVTIFLNACAAKKNKEPAYIISPDVVKNNRKSRINPVNRTKCKIEECPDYCKGIEFFYTFKKIK